MEKPPPPPSRFILCSSSPSSLQPLPSPPGEERPTQGAFKWRGWWRWWRAARAVADLFSSRRMVFFTRRGRLQQFCENQRRMRRRRRRRRSLFSSDKSGRKQTALVVSATRRRKSEAVFTKSQLEGQNFIFNTVTVILFKVKRSDWKHQVKDLSCTKLNRFTRCHKCYFTSILPLSNHPLAADHEQVKLSYRSH